MKIGGVYNIEFTRVSKTPKFNVNIKSGDNKRIIKLTLLENNMPLNLNDYTIVIAAKKNDNSSVFNNVEIIDAENGICEVEITQQMLALNDALYCEIILYGADGTVASSSDFVLNIIKSIKSEESIESSSEFTALTKALSDVVDVKSKIEAKRDKSVKITGNDLDISSDENKIKLNNLSQEVHNALSGNSSVSAEIPNIGITSEKYAPNSIKEEHTSFIELGINLYNKNTISDLGWWLNISNGLPETNEYVTNLHYSDYIPVIQDSLYSLSEGVHSCCFYNIEKEFISGSRVDSNNITVPNGVSYIRLNIINKNKDYLQLQKGDKIEQDYPYEISIKNLDITRRFNSKEESINKIPKVINDLNKVEKSLSNSFDSNEEFDFVEFRPFNRWDYTSSVFSGWSSCIGQPKDFNIVKFKVRARDEHIKKIKVFLQEDSASGNILVEEDLDVSISPNEVSEITWEIPKIIDNKNDKFIQFTYQCDKLSDLYMAGSIQEPYPLTRYSINGTFQHPSSMKEVSDIEYGGPVVWTEVGFKKIRYTIPDKSIESVVNKIVDKEGFKNSFEIVDTFNAIESSGSNNEETYNKSTFSGWGGHIGVFEEVHQLKFSVRNRDSKPTNKIKCYITDFNKDGDILAEGVINTKIPVGERQDIIWELNEPLLNPERKKLYFIYMCDTLITKVSINLDSDGDNITYGWPSYVTNGNIELLPSQMTQVQPSSGDTGGKNSIWCQIGNTKKTYKPTQEFINNMPKQTGNYCRVVLPNTITAVVGDNLQLFYRGIIEAVNPYNYDIRIRCAKGKAYHRYYEFLPSSSDVGEYNFAVEVYDNQKQLLDSAKTKIKVVDTNKAVSSLRNILCVGDSLTSQGIWCSETLRRLTKSGGSPVGIEKTNIKFIGTKKNNECGYEGYGGWTWDSYLSKPDIKKSDIWIYCTHDKTSSDQHSIWQDVNGSKWSLETIESNRLKFTRYESHTNQAPSSPGTLTHIENAVNTSNIDFTDCRVADSNPFWDISTNRVNFKKYCETHGFNGIDYVYTLLTWNGGRVDMSTVEDNKNIVSQAKKFIDILHQDYPNAKVRIMGIQLPSLNGGTGSNYGANGGYSDTYGLIRGVFGLNIAYQELANDPNYSDYVEFVNVSSQFDSEYNMPYAMSPVNNRSTVTEMKGTNGVHPSQEGYLQIGDIAYRSLVKDLLI